MNQGCCREGGCGWGAKILQFEELCSAFFRIINVVSKLQMVRCRGLIIQVKRNYLHHAIVVDAVLQPLEMMLRLECFQ